MNEKHRIQTLTENHLFAKAYRKGRCFSGRYISMYVLRNLDRSRTLLGITVSKNRGNAVKRNRTKRIIREAYRIFHPFVRKGFIIVIVAKQQAVDAHISAVTTELSEFLEKAALLDETDQ